MTQPESQFVRLLFLSLDPRWRRLDAAEQSAQRRDLGDAVLEHRTRLLLRSYGLAGTRGDASGSTWLVGR